MTISPRGMNERLNRSVERSLGAQPGCPSLFYEPAQESSQADSSVKKVSRVASLMELSGRAVLQNRHFYSKQALHEDLQHVLLANVKNLTDYRTVLNSSLIERESLEDFLRMQLEKREILVSNQRAPAVFFNLFFVERVRQISLEERRKWIFAAKHPQAAFFLLPILKIAKAAGSFFTQFNLFWKKIQSPLPYRLRFQWYQLPILGALYGVYSLIFMLQSMAWKRFIPTLRYVAILYQSSRSIRIFKEMMIFVFNHQFWLVLACLGLLYHVKPRNPRVLAITDLSLGAMLGVIVAPSLVIVPVFFSAFIIYLFVGLFFRNKAFVQRFSSRMKQKITKGMWPLLTSPHKALSQAEKIWMRKIRVDWLHSLPMTGKIGTKP